jgi:hypothetical protein
MDVTFLELHLDDVAVAVSGGPDAVASTEPDDAGSAAADGLPWAVLALVPVFVVLGVAAGFLAARRFRTDRSAVPGADVEIGTEAR